LAKEREILTDGLLELGIDPKMETVAAFDLYRQELKKWNRVHNITSITDDIEIVVKHFLDSLLYLRAIPAGKLILCDVGSGGGFPGLPIAIVRPDLEVTLLEPARKKIAFLKRMRRLLSLKNVEIIDARAEEVTDRQFDVVVTRALFTVSDMVDKAGHLVKKGGFLVLNKGPKYEEEVRQLPPSVPAEVMSVTLKKAHLTRNLITVANP
jgi:16S rRNA (guanine527-N7)-methyltransferase